VRAEALCHGFYLFDVGGGTNMLSFGRFENADVIAAGVA
jgi:hypothetical protein